GAIGVHGLTTGRSGPVSGTVPWTCRKRPIGAADTGLAEGAAAGAGARRADRGDRRLGAVRRRPGGRHRRLPRSSGVLVRLADDGAPDVRDLARGAALLPRARGRRDAPQRVARGGADAARLRAGDA